MPLSQLDARAALVVIDLQKGVLALPADPPIGPVVERSAALARAFRAKGHAVVWINVDALAPGRTERGFRFDPPAGWEELSPDLGVERDDLRLTKQSQGAFLSTDLAAQLERRGVTQVVLTGVATGSGVEATGRSAYDLGYNVVYVTDAMTDLDPETHAFCLRKTFPRIGETTTTAELLAKLGG